MFTDCFQKFIHGVYLALWFASANRDESVFENPCAFDLRRSPNEHLAFSKGACFAGAHLTRLELRLMLTRISALC
jgi:cytochrome P450